MDPPFVYWRVRPRPETTTINRMGLILAEETPKSGRRVETTTTVPTSRDTVLRVSSPLSDWIGTGGFWGCPVMTQKYCES